jgi:hypothetical protein
MNNQPMLNKIQIKGHTDWVLHCTKPVLVKIRLSSFTGGGRPQAQMGT